MNENKKRDISLVSVNDKLVGASGILTSIIIPLAVILILAISWVANEPTKDDILVYILGLLVLVFYFPFFVSSIRKLILIIFKSIGRKIYLKKHNDGFPIDENNRYYRYVDNMYELRDDKNIIIQNESNIDSIKKATYLNNMEIKRREYVKKLKKMSKKLLKKINKIKNSKNVNTELLKKYEENYENVMYFLGLCNDMYNSILNYDYDKIELLDKELFADININYIELNHEEIVHKTFDVDGDDAIEKFLNNPIIRKLRLYVMTVLSFAIIGFVMLYWRVDSFDIDGYALGYLVSILIILISRTKNIFTDTLITFKEELKRSQRYIEILAIYNILKNRNTIIEEKSITEQILPVSEELEVLITFEDERED